MNVRAHSRAICADKVGTAAIVAVMLLLLWPPARLVADTNIFSATVSYNYVDDFIPSPVVSYQYYEWPGNDALGLLSAQTASYFYQSGSGTGGFIVVQGRVINASIGTGIPNASVQVCVALSPVAETTTDGSGYYMLPAFGTGTYVLQATAAGYATAVRVLTLTGSLAVQDFRMNALPAAPTVQQTTRQFTRPPVGPWLSNLKVFDGTGVTNITVANTPDPNRMTIVLTHGWVKTNASDSGIMNTPFDLWPAAMAEQLRANGITSDIANIVVWDWRYAAEDPGWSLFGIARYEPAFAAQRTPEQGIALGTTLLDVLGADYSQPIHFIGHSLGTIVNAAAINYLHGVSTGRQIVSPTPWPIARVPIHVTLLDQAGVAKDFGGWFLSLGNNASQANWQPVLPFEFTWADNCVSLVGYDLPAAVNVWLQTALGTLEEQHGYPIWWYTNSIANPSYPYNPLGFGQSYEYYKLAGWPDSLFPPVSPPVGSVYQQKWFANPLALEPASFWGNQPLFEAGGEVVVLAQAGMETFGQVVADVQAGAQKGWQAVMNAFNYAGGLAQQGGQALVNFCNSAVLRLNLTTGPPQSGQSMQNSLLQTSDYVGTNESNTPAMAWVSAQIPSNAVVMTFDFIVSGDPVEDALVFAVGTNSQFSLAAKYIPTNTVSTSSQIDISAWAGTTNELFFGLLGGTSTNANLQIDNIRFYSLQQSPAVLSGSPTNGVAPLIVTFADASSGTITNWFWDFGDGIMTNLVGTSIAHTYSSPGTNSVTLIVSGPLGSSTNTLTDFIWVMTLFQGWQIQYFGSTVSPQAAPDMDASGTGMSNLQKYLAGLDPTNSASVFRITEPEKLPDGSGFKVTWSSVPGKTYKVLYSDSPGGSWQEDLPSSQITADTGQTSLSYTDSTVGASTKRFYRIKLVVP